MKTKFDRSVNTFKKEVKQYYDSDDGNFSDFLYNRGFKQFGNYSYVFYRDDLIVKNSSYMIICGSKPRKHTVPIKYIKPDNYNRWYIQPKCLRTRLLVACNYLKKMIPNWYDAHTGNCGWYLGKPVIFDW